MQCSLKQFVQNPWIEAGQTEYRGINFRGYDLIITLTVHLLRWIDFWLAAATLEISISIYLMEVEPLKKDIYYSIFMLVSSLKTWLIAALVLVPSPLLYSGVNVEIKWPNLQSFCSPLWESRQKCSSLWSCFKSWWLSCTKICAAVAVQMVELALHSKVVDSYAQCWCSFSGAALHPPWSLCLWQWQITGPAVLWKWRGGEGQCHARRNCLVIWKCLHFESSGKVALNQCGRRERCSVGLCHPCGHGNSWQWCFGDWKSLWSFPRFTDSSHGNWANNFTKECFPVDSSSLYAVSSVNDCFIAKIYLFGCIVCTVFLCTRCAYISEISRGLMISPDIS